MIALAKELQRRNKELEAKETAYNEKDKRLAEFEQLSKELVAKCAKQEEEVNEKSEQLAEKNKQLVEKDKELAELREQLTKNAGAVSKLEAECHSKEKQLLEKKVEIKKFKENYDSKVGQLNEKLKAKSVKKDDQAKLIPNPSKNSEVRN